MTSIMTIAEWLQQATHQLAAVTDVPQLEAEILLAHALKKSRSYLYAWPQQTVASEDAQHFIHLLAQRARSKPIAYITGKKEFWSLELFVNENTLIPRPETELLVASVLNLFPEQDKAVQVADLGTGSGAIALALASERPAWQIHAVDISEAALSVARKNGRHLTLQNIIFHQGNWCEALPAGGFDVIVSNPPYIATDEWRRYADGLAYEPENALLSGEDGLAAIREIINTAKSRLKQAGYLLIEHGFAQGEAVQRLFSKNGYSHVHSLRDLQGQTRVTLGRYAGA
ncbi:Release factor glutamine methyltransferase [Aquicella lusitana]|uniref:Release factor glutamine methyltransferase n=3 Tax=Aquicella lusitana TaxID=254246 RepID=A0A370GZ79_9COXI|nr:[protein release factor]-glutamine N5-methyltransferase [Aquicella lusitana]VVC74017.1 Release factor glutamine methyltransferase [Aquicella lusitana]